MAGGVEVSASKGVIRVDLKKKHGRGVSGRPKKNPGYATDWGLGTEEKGIKRMYRRFDTIYGDLCVISLEDTKGE